MQSLRVWSFSSASKKGHSSSVWFSLILPTESIFVDWHNTLCQSSQQHSRISMGMPLNSPICWERNLSTEQYECCFLKNQYLLSGEEHCNLFLDGPRICAKPSGNLKAYVYQKTEDNTRTIILVIHSTWMSWRLETPIWSRSVFVLSQIQTWFMVRNIESFFHFLHSFLWTRLFWNSNIFVLAE